MSTTPSSSAITVNINPGQDSYIHGSFRYPPASGEKYAQHEIDKVTVIVPIGKFIVEDKIPAVDLKACSFIAGKKLEKAPKKNARPSEYMENITVKSTVVIDRMDSNAGIHATVEKSGYDYLDFFCPFTVTDVNNIDFNLSKEDIQKGTEVFVGTLIPTTITSTLTANDLVEYEKATLHSSSIKKNFGTTFEVKGMKSNAIISGFTASTAHTYLQTPNSYTEPHKSNTYLFTCEYTSGAKKANVSVSISGSVNEGSTITASFPVSEDDVASEEDTDINIFCEKMVLTRDVDTVAPLRITFLGNDSPKRAASNEFIVDATVTIENSAFAIGTLAATITLVASTFALFF